MASGSVAITLLALDVLLVREELNEKDCAGGAGVSTAENLSLRFNFTADVEAGTML